MRDYETDLDSRSYNRPYRDESAIAFSAIDCVLNGEQAVYASSELTTGLRAYALLRELGLGRIRDLDDEDRATLFRTNAEEASAFAQRLRERFDGRWLVITPAPYTAPEWTQAEYLTFWETLIRTRIRAVCFNDNWEYSNGCTFEFAIAAECAVPTFDAAMQPLSVGDGAARIVAAAADLEKRGLVEHRLRLNLARLRRIA